MFSLFSVLLKLFTDGEKKSTADKKTTYKKQCPFIRIVCVTVDKHIWNVETKCFYAYNKTDWNIVGKKHKNKRTKMKKKKLNRIKKKKYLVKTKTKTKANNHIHS